MTGESFLQMFGEGSGVAIFRECYEGGGKEGDVVGEHLCSVWIGRVGVMADDMVTVLDERRDEMSLPNSRRGMPSCTAYINDPCDS